MIKRTHPIKCMHSLECKDHVNCGFMQIRKNGDGIHTKQQAERYAREYLSIVFRIIKQYDLCLENLN